MTANDLAQRLDARRNGDGWKARCPAHDDRTPSLRIRDGRKRVFVDCFAGCTEADILNSLNLKVSDLFHDNMTAGEFINEATKTFNATPPRPQPDARVEKALRDYDEGKALDKLPATLSPLSSKEEQAVAKWRGYSLELVQWLNKFGLIGKYKDCIGAFPVTNGVHYRVKPENEGDKSEWRYSYGAKPDLFVLGGIEEGAHVHVFESQWDALAFADAMGERTNIVATRGASNVTLLRKFDNYAGTLYLWPQHDAPGQKWADDIAKDLNCQLKIVQWVESGDRIGTCKDLNEWRLAGATDGEIMNAFLDAKDFSAAAQPSASSPPVEGAGKAFDSLVPAVSVAAENPTFPVRNQSDPTPVASADALDARATDASGGEKISASTQRGENGLASMRSREPHAQAETLASGCEADASEASRGDFVESVPLAAEPPHRDISALLAPISERVVTTGTVGASDQASLSGAKASARSPELAKTLDATVAFLRRYVVFPLDEQADVIALWVAHSWTFSSFRFTPYLNVCSPEKRCGKTRLIDCLELVVPKPRRADTITAAALRRAIDSERPTLLLDEIDTVFSGEKNEANEALRGALNAGFQAGGKYTCCDGARNEIKDFHVFCPKVIAGIGKGLPDTVRDRSIEVRLIRQTSDAKASTFRQHEAESEAAPIRSELDSWSRASGKSLAQARPSMPSQLGDRQQDMMEPLVAIADDAGGEWPQRARDALVGIGATHEDSSTGVQLLADCRMIFEATSLDRITTTGLLSRLVEIESDSSPWPTWWEGDIKNNKLHSPAAKLAKLLKPFGIKPATIRVGDDDVAKGYNKQSFQDAWKRYLEPIKGLTNMELNL